VLVGDDALEVEEEGQDKAWEGAHPRCPRTRVTLAMRRKEASNPHSRKVTSHGQLIRQHLSDLSKSKRKSDDEEWAHTYTPDHQTWIVYAKFQ
jgi:hypothetical protein